jgi:hypothetical protein
MTGIRPGDSWTWHGLGLSVAASKTESVAVVVGYGDQRIAIVEAGTGAQAVVPPGEYAVVDVGDGAAEPTLDGVGARLLLAQDVAGKPIARSLRSGFSRELWQASHEGSLEITCDQRRCAW